MDMQQMVTGQTSERCSSTTSRKSTCCKAKSVSICPLKYKCLLISRNALRVLLYNNETCNKCPNIARPPFQVLSVMGKGGRSLCENVYSKAWTVCVDRTVFT